MKLLKFPDSKLKWEPLLYNFRSERVNGHLVTGTLVGDEEESSLINAELKYCHVYG